MGTIHFQRGVSGVVCALAAAMFAAGASGQVLNESAKLLASDGEAIDFFGNSVSVSGDTAVVGASRDDDAGTDSGSAYVFVHSGGVWTQQQKLTASDAAAGDRFGTSVSLSGDTAVVGARFDDDAASASGSAYVFVRSGGVWTQQQKLTASDGAGDDGFGISVFISGETVVVGAHNDDDAGIDSGSAYVFVRSGGVWTEQQKLTASDASTGDKFGESVAIDGEIAAVGSHNDDDACPSDQLCQSGSAYVFVRAGGVWTQQQKLFASDAAAGDRFGVSVSIEGDTAVVGAPFDDDAGDAFGSAYVFVHSGGVWSEQQKLTASDAAGDDRFGFSVYIDGDTAAVGAQADDDAGSASGSAYVFMRSGGVWTEQQKLTASDAAAGNEFGSSVSVSGDTVVVGAPFDDDACPSDPACNSGSAYVFSPLLGTCCISDGTCDAEGNCQENLTQVECQSLGGSFLRPDVSCAEACLNGQCVPTVSQWGLVALMLALLAAGTIVLRPETALKNAA